MSTNTLRIRFLSLNDAANQPFKNILLYIKNLTHVSAPGGKSLLLEISQVLEEKDRERAIVLSFNETFDLLEDEEYFQVLFIKNKAEFEVIADVIFWRHNLLHMVNNRKASDGTQSELVRHATLEQNYVLRFSLQLIEDFAEKNELSRTMTNQSTIWGHSMSIKQFNQPVYCAICGKFIWGVHRQGYQCSQCSLVTHRKCCDCIPFWCQKSRDPAPKILFRNREVRMHIPHSFDHYTSPLIQPLTSRRRSHCSHCGSQVVRKALKCKKCCFIIHERCELNTPALCTIMYSSMANVLENKLFKSIEPKELTKEIWKGSDSSLSDPPWLEPLVDNNLIPVPKFSDFECIGRLGKGRYGIVYCVEHIPSKERLAIKVVDGFIAEARHQFAVERQILYRYSHTNPYMIKAYCTFHQGNSLFLVMEYVDGDTLCQKIERTRMNEFEIRFYLAEIMSVVQYLHSNKIVYRDLKLEHILIRSDGHIRLIDYGLGRILNSSDELCHTICGTPSYMAPEISGLPGDGYSYSVDYWAMGMIFVQMLCGERFDFHPENDSLLNFHENLHLPHHISAEARSCLTGLLESNPKERLGSPNSPHGPIREHPFFQMGHKINWQEVDDGLSKSVQRKQLVERIPSNIFDSDFSLSSSLLDRAAGAKADWIHIAESRCTPADEEQFKVFDYVNEATWCRFNPPK